MELRLPNIIFGFLITFIVLKCYDSAMSDWQNDCENFKDYQWPWKKCKFQYGLQSPINIDTSNVETVKLPILNFHLDWSLIKKNILIKNNGRTWSIKLDADVQNPPYLTNGPVGKAKYIFEESHAYWKNDQSGGSEHLVNKKSYAMETHLMFYKEEYGSLDNAKNYPDGVAIAAIFGDVSSEHNPFWDDLISKIPYILTPGSSVDGSFGTEFMFLQGVPNQPKYYAYPGSLTTPNFNFEECVTWMVFAYPFYLSPDQLNSFQQIISNTTSRSGVNDRELQYFNCRPLITPRDRECVKIHIHFDGEL